MDPIDAKHLRSRLTLHFAVLAVLTAMLVSYGSGSFFLPAFIFVVCVFGFFVVDLLELFALNRVGVFIGMTIGTTVAIANYIYSAFYAPSESGQLHSVAGLLIFPEAVLFLQRKNLRVFEQLAIFLLLEMMVAALVNDNLMFGVLLIPIVLLWVSSLFLFSRYATIVHIAPDVEVPMPKLAELLYARFIRKIMGDETKPTVVESRLIVPSSQRQTGSSARFLQSVPLGIAAIVFSMMFFYLLPRATSGGYRPRLGNQSRVGLPGNMRLGQLGRALGDPTPIMRLTLKNELTRKNYDVTEGPYLRGRVYDRFQREGANSRWFLDPMPRSGVKLNEFRELGRQATENRDRVLVEFDLLPSARESIFTLPPSYAVRGGKRAIAKLDLYTQLLQSDLDEDEDQHSLPYTLGSTAFWNGEELGITPMLSSGGLVQSGNMFRDVNRSMGQFKPDDFLGVEELRQRIIQDAGVPEHELLQVAKSIEKYFSSGREFTYTLDLSAKPNPALDPIEDFVVNQRKGHCQYFAATMLVMLHQSNIPARLIAGYKPREFNKHGRYFFVKQNDAHAWVEALFHSRQLRGTVFEQWTQPESYYWLRFDPTPPAMEGEEDIVDQPNALSDYAEKLWKGYVLEGRELTGENSIYAPVARVDKETYDDLARQWDTILEHLKSGNFGAAAGSIRFSWPLAAVIIAIGFVTVFVWQLLLMSPAIRPLFERRFGLRSRETLFKQDFFARCARALERLGFERDKSQTPEEITKLAADFLEHKRGLPDSSDWLRLLTENYYRLRFGNVRSLSDQEQAEVHLALRKLEKSVSKIEPIEPNRR